MKQPYRTGETPLLEGGIPVRLAPLARGLANIFPASG